MANYNSCLKHLPEHLDPGEKVLASCFGAYETKSLGQKTVKNGILVVTEKRMLFYGKRTFGFDIETFSFDKITALEVGKDLMGKKITIKMSGNQSELKWINQGDPDSVVAQTREAMAATTTKSQPQALPDKDVIFSQIQKLAQLKQTGVITEAEFNAKKTELLERL